MSTETIAQNTDLVKDFSAWLSTFEWTAYCTLTFRRPMRQGALRCGRAWVRWIANRYGEARAFLAEEHHADGERLHLHALIHIADGDLVDLTPWWRWWWTKFGRCEVRRYQARRGAAGYCSKYILKEAQDRGSWDLLVEKQSHGRRKKNLQALRSTVQLQHGQG